MNIESPSIRKRYYWERRIERKAKAWQIECERNTKKSLKREWKQSVQVH